jgi:two-component system chemotaxis response regulator CheY
MGLGLTGKQGIRVRAAESGSCFFLPNAASFLADIPRSRPRNKDAPKTLIWRRKGCYFMGNIRALIVDDSSVMRKIVARSLRQAGINLAEVLEAGNGVEALGLLQANHVDLILCDINMPVMDGLEFIKRLSTIEQAKGVPVIMVTTEGSESHVVEALSNGARGYLRKPFTAEQVKQHVVPFLAGKS